MAERPDDLQVLLDTADEMLAQGEVEQALLLLEKLSEQHPGSPEVMLLLGDARMDWGDLDGALQAYDKAVSLEPNWGLAFAARARCLVELGRLAEAQSDVERALRLDSKCPEAHFVRAILLEFAGQYKLADDAYRTAARLDPEHYFVPARVSRKRFEAIVRKAISRLPEKFKKHMNQVAICVRDLPDLNDEASRVSPLVMGFFDGCPITDRRQLDPWTQFPARIFLYQRNIERACSTPRQLLEEVEITLLHEIGHFFGLEEEDLERIDLL